MSRIITNKGLGIITGRIKGTGTEPLKIGWGIGTTDAAAGDTTLETEDTTGGYARASGSSTVTTTSVTGDTYQVSGSLTALAALAITEWALFNTAGDMICREVLVPGFSLDPGDILNFTFKFQDIR